MTLQDFDIINSKINWYIYRDKTILITGVTGRLGRYFLESLAIADTDYNLNMHILGVARSSEKAEQVFGEILKLPNVSLIYQDINAEIEYSGTIDYIFHTAGPAAPVDFNKASVETLWAHVNGTHNILECARTHGTRRVFYVSTVETYGEWKDDRPIREIDMGVMRHNNYRACYPEAKRLCETMLSCYKAEYGIDFCGMRCCHTLGPGIVLNDGRAFAEFIECALEGQNIELYSDGSAMRTYTYTADVINAAFLIMEKGKSQFYNVANLENLISIRDLAKLIASLSPAGKISVVYGKTAKALPYLPFKLGIMDTAEITALGWQPKTDLYETFYRTITYLYNKQTY